MMTSFRILAGYYCDPTERQVAGVFHNKGLIFVLPLVLLGVLIAIKRNPYKDSRTNAISFVIVGGVVGGVIGAIIWGIIAAIVGGTIFCS